MSAATMTVWTLTIDGDYSVTTEAFPDEGAVYAALRRLAEPWDDSGELLTAPMADVIDFLTERAGYCLYIDAHEVQLPGSPAPADETEVAR